MSTASDRAGVLLPADIIWQHDGTPLSRHYQDVFYSSCDGLAESRHVFLRPNGLPERWGRLTAARPRFVIMETGFGTGLNFLATWALWRQARPAGAHLHFVSIEKHPLSAAELARAGQAFPSLAELCGRLVERYPLTLPGLHPVTLGDGVELTLAFGEVADMLDALGDCDHPRWRRELSVAADAWYLDGFAPARNPAMWTPEVLRGVAALSRPGTTLATFTAAGAVRRGLAEAGFSMHKVPGYGRKRDMLCGRFEASPNEPAAPHGRRLRRPPLAWHAGLHPPVVRRHALVIGAGLAGCHTAAALAEAGWEVTVAEGAAAAAAGASGNEEGILYPRLSPADSPLSRFYLLAFLQAQRHYRGMFRDGQLQEGRDGQLAGMLQLGFDEGERAHLQAVAQRYRGLEDLVRPVTARQASELAGVALAEPALLFPGSGWLSPRRLCAELLNHPRILVSTGQPVVGLTREGDSWYARTDAGEDLQAPVCIVAAGPDCLRLAPLAFLPTRAVGGQITRFRPSGPVPRLPLCHEGYLIPRSGGQLSCGATYRINDAGTELRGGDHRRNLQQLSRYLPALLPPEDLDALATSGLGGRAGARCTTPDYLPIVGPAPDLPALREAFAPLARDARAAIAERGHFLPGLYVNTGHGSRGLGTTPMAAALLTALIEGSPRPLEWPLVKALSPARFPIRALIRGTDARH